MSKCIICNNNTEPYFTKTFNVFNLTKVEYVKCTNCKHVVSKTHSNMSEEDWEKLNKNYHDTFRNKDVCEDDKRWFERLKLQAEVIRELNENNIIPYRKNSWLDFGAGDAKLYCLLKNNYNINIKNYDPYIITTDDSFVTEENLLNNKYNFITSISVFEHLRFYKDIHKVLSLVPEDGIFGLHTYIGEDIPTDPNWFYLLPVHCCFYTNDSMRIIFKRYNFQCSIYEVNSRFCIMFKKTEDIEYKINKINTSLGRQKYYFKLGFMDYWK